jgi:hypothetical protein
MAKLKTDPITAEDLEEFVRTSSDFAFEMQVLKQLRELGFECSHSGTYQDPVTGKVRQFDIRAVRSQRQSTLALAVECKNLRENSPLLISAVPRTPAESFHNVIVCLPSQVNTLLHIEEKRHAYRPGEMAGKKTDQVGRDVSGVLTSNDEATFDKLNQAVNSCRDLIQQFASQPVLGSSRTIVPLLVVPQGLLWQVEYDADGAVTAEPRQVPRATLYLDYTWSVKDVNRTDHAYRLSHVEFATIDALPRVNAEHWGRFFSI